MARLKTCGAEIELSSTGGPDAQLSILTTRDTTLFRSGLASWKCQSGAGGSQAYFQALSSVSLAASTTYYFRAYFCFATLPSTTDAPIMSFQQGVGYAVVLRTTGKLALRFGASLVGSDSAVTIVADGVTWYRIELKLVMNASTQYSAGELQLDGVSVATDSGRTTAPTSPALYAGWGVAGASPDVNLTLNVDDIAFNDSTGATQTSWPGEGKVVLLKPISDNARVGWTNAAAGTTNLFNDVNSLPPVGVASPAAQPAQIKRAAANTTDTYDTNLTSYLTAGLQPNYLLNAISIVFNIGYSNASVASEGLQMLSNPAISEFTTSTDGSAAGTYPAHWTWGSKIAGYSGTVVSNGVTVGTSPVLRVRKNTSSSSRSQFCDFMGAYVDYTPVSDPTAWLNARRTPRRRSLQRM